MRGVLILLLTSFFLWGNTTDLERGELFKSLERFLEGKATEQDLYLIKSLGEDIEGKPPEHIKLFTKGLLAERRGDYGKALENYLRSIELKPDYNPSYFRFNEVIRKVKNPETYREKLTQIVRRRFSNPPPVIVENPNNKYVFLVEKMSQYLLVYRGKELEALYPVTTGKDWEDKWVEGDSRTPEGIYYFTEFVPPERLSSTYGGIAVALNYPNPVDALLGKKGSGIWLHGSDKEDRNSIPFSTRGCVVAGNRDLKAIVRNISLTNTLIGIFKEIPQKIGTEDVVSFLESWKRSWERKDIEGYLSHYSSRFTWERGDFKEWERYKRKVILEKKRIEVNVGDLTLLAFRRGLSDEVEYYVAEFRQTYRSDSYSDSGLKRLYIIKEKGRLKILREEFAREG